MHKDCVWRLEGSTYSGAVQINCTDGGEWNDVCSTEEYTEEWTDTLSNTVCNQVLPGYTGFGKLCVTALLIMIHCLFPETIATHMVGNKLSGGIECSSEPCDADTVINTTCQGINVTCQSNDGCMSGSA